MNNCHYGKDNESKNTAFPFIHILNLVNGAKSKYYGWNENCFFECTFVPGANASFFIVIWKEEIYNNGNNYFAMIILTPVSSNLLKVSGEIFSSVMIY